MKYRCSWCGATWQNAEKLPASLPAGTISHGICKPCSQKMERGLALKPLPKKS